MASWQEGLHILSQWEALLEENLGQEHKSQQCGNKSCAGSSTTKMVSFKVTCSACLEPSKCHLVTSTAFSKQTRPCYSSQVRRNQAVIQRNENPDLLNMLNTLQYATSQEELGKFFTGKVKLTRSSGPKKLTLSDWRLSSTPL